MDDPREAQRQYLRSQGYTEAQVDALMTPLPQLPTPVQPESQGGLNVVIWVLLGAVVLGAALVCVVLPLVFNANNH